MKANIKCKKCKIPLVLNSEKDIDRELVTKKGKIEDWNGYEKCKLKCLSSEYISYYICPF